MRLREPKQRVTAVSRLRLRTKKRGIALTSPPQAETRPVLVWLKQHEKMRTYSGIITTLSDDEVFVFGANLQGFHGAGSAGYASFGEAGNVWRKHGYDKQPDGTKGHWNIKGKIGPMQGLNGKSYGLPTVTRAGAKRSLEPDFAPLYECCRRNPQWTFYFAQEG